MLSRYLPKEEGNTIRTEMFSDLHGSYYDYPTYKKYISTCCNDIDPMNSDAFVKHMQKISKGKKSLEIRSLTF
jgi:bacterioferritin (cytochrome b1)